MQSKTSFYNHTILRTDLTRFTPMGILYALGLLLLYLLGLGQAQNDYYIAHFLRDYFTLMVAINGLYGLLVSQMLFGELFNARACNTIHAMPVTRDSLFRTHVLSGFLFSWVPNVLATLVLLPWFDHAAPAALWLMLGSCLMFVFYFGTSVLSIQLSGNRIGAVLIYGILNFFTVLAGWFERYLYEPLLYGCDLNEDLLFRLCPTYGMGVGGYLDIAGKDEAFKGIISLDYVTPAAGWIRLVIWAVVGVVAFALAQILYRRRKLEVAGDLMAYPKLNNLFQLFFALTVGGFFHLGSTMVTNDGYIWMAVLGIAVGWYLGGMLIARKVNVFSRRTVFPLAGILVIFCGSLLLTALDVGGIARKVPEIEEIQEIAVYPRFHSTNRITMEDPEDFQKITAQHRILAADSIPHSLGLLKGSETMIDYSDATVYVTYEYTLKNGSTLKRTYGMLENMLTEEPLNSYFRRPEALLGMPKAELNTLAERVTDIDVIVNWGRSNSISRQEDTAELLEAILADIQEGTVIPAFAWYGRTIDAEDNSPDVFIYINYYQTSTEDGLPGRVFRSTELYFNETCVHTMQWLEENGYFK